LRQITLVTGSADKLAEWREAFPGDFDFETADIDLDEIQSLDLEAIAVDKAKRAYDQLGRPVIVEDVSAGLENLGGLPGPFIKYFEKQLGDNALYELGKDLGGRAVLTCTIAYYDGEDAVTAQGEVTGEVCPPRGENGFGFDFCFQQDGQTKTYAEMTPEEKGKISYRALAIKNMLEQLKQL